MRLHSAAAFVVLATRLTLISSLPSVIPGQITVTPPPEGTCQPLLEPYCTFQFEPSMNNHFTRNSAYFPNTRGQRSFREALPEFQHYIELLQSGCSDQLGVLLCFHYFPLCNYRAGNGVNERGTLERIGPCKSVCEEARRDCEPLMVRRGYSWPQHLDCSLDYFLTAHNDSQMNFICVKDGSMSPYPTEPPATREPDPCSGSGLTCAPDCGSPLPPADGSVEYETTTVGSEATYQCNDDFTLVGDSHAVCQSDGMWSGEQPTCVPDCGNPLSPRHGAVEYESVIPGSQAHYRCDDYYVLVGDKSLTCENGVWVGKQPTCQRCRLRSRCTANTFRNNDYTFAIHARVLAVYRANGERNVTFTINVEEEYLNLGGGPSQLNTIQLYNMSTTDCCDVCDRELSLKVGKEYLLAGYFTGSQWYLDTQDSLVSLWVGKYSRKLQEWIRRGHPSP